MTKSLESLRLAEAFFAERPELLSTVRAFLTETWERWPETEVVTQKSQVTLRGPRPFCALSTHIRFPRMPGPCYVTLSLFLPRSLPDLRGGMAVEPYPGRWTNHILITRPEEVDVELMEWLREAHNFALRKR